MNKLKIDWVKIEDLSFNEMSWYMKGIKEALSPDKQIVKRFNEVLDSLE